jgi:AAA+ superfamily predicted ATPase
MAGFFKVKDVKHLDSLKIGDQINESDFATLTPTGHFVQLEYVEDKEEIKPFIVKPGVWAIKETMFGLTLETTSFIKDKILEDFVYTKNIEKCINAFFNKLDVYREHGIEVPKRGMLLYGPPGTGKSTVINKVCTEYAKDGKTAVVVWPTDKLEAHQVRGFIKTFEYEGVDKVILVMEDIGGVEIDQVRMKSTSSLLALLDNQEKVFRIPVFILATTNFPEVFLGNLTNRPGRFDDKIELKNPPAEARKQLFKFFLRRSASEETLEMIKDKRFAEFSPAHIKEVVLRSAIYDMSLEDSMNSVAKEIEIFKKNFDTKRQGLGIGAVHEDY